MGVWKNQKYSRRELVKFNSISNSLPKKRKEKQKLTNKNKSACAIVQVYMYPEVYYLHEVCHFASLL